MATTAFQSTFPRGERPKVTEIKSGIDDFNPRSRVGNDAFLVSIIVQVIKFQSTFPRGERPSDVALLTGNNRFQSTFPRGERQRCPKSYYGRTVISIHVPAWGTTFSGFALGFRYCHFNPRSRVGNDTNCGFSGCIHVFQSTFPRGERQKSKSHNCKRFDFNPRSRVGNDGVRI